jgi:hypothetical protein
MVNRNVIKRKPKAARKSRAAEHIANLNAYGQEPGWKVGQVPTQSERAHALTWYNVLADRYELREWLFVWLEKKGHGDLMRQVKSLPEQRYTLKYLPRTACALARMEDLGARVEADEFIVRSVEDSVSMIARDHQLGASVRETESDDGTVKETVETDPAEEEQRAQADAFQSRIRSRVGQVKDHLEDRLLDGLYAGFDVYSFLKSNNYPTGLATRLEDALVPIAQDYEFAISTGEGFGSTPKKVLKAKRDYVLRAVDDLRRYASNEKKIKTPRKKKPISVEKKLRDFHYMKEHKELRVASINPAEIIGAKEVWFYDTRGNTLTVLRSGIGLDVHRTTIVNYAVEASFTKKAGRRPDKWVDRARTDGRVNLRKLMDDIKKPALTPTRDRCNVNTLLLRIIK